MSRETQEVKYRTSAGSIAIVTYSKYPDGWYATVERPFVEWILRDLGWTEVAQ